MSDINKSPSTENSRYRRQIRFAPLGESGQNRMAAAHAIICGVGALGSVIAERLGRAGVGRLTLIDRDWVELDNLPRQALFTEAHVTNRQPKAIAAADQLREINSELNIISIVEDLTHLNADRLLGEGNVIVDGTDNFETRFLINDYAVKNNIPWVHGGCIGASGQVMTIVPGKTACFRCLVPDLPTTDSLETCDTAGVLGPAVMVIAAWQAAEAMKVLSGNLDAIKPVLSSIDLWESTVRQISTANLAGRKNCPTCGKREFPFLEGLYSSDAKVLCGKNSVQVSPPQSVRLDLDRVAKRWQALGTVQANRFLIRLQLAEHQLTLFQDGRAVITGTEDPAEARTLYAKFVGT